MPTPSANVRNTAGPADGRTDTRQTASSCSVGSAAIANRYVGFGGRRGATVRDIFVALETGDSAASATIEEPDR